MTANSHSHLPKPEPYQQRLGSGDGEREASMTRQMRCEAIRLKGVSAGFMMLPGWLVGWANVVSARGSLFGVPLVEQRQVDLLERRVCMELSDEVLLMHVLGPKVLPFTSLLGTRNV